MFTIETVDGTERAAANTYDDAVYGAGVMSGEDRMTLHVRDRRGRLVAIGYRGTVAEFACKCAVEV